MLIYTGKVAVNNQQIKNIAQKVDTENDKIDVEGEPALYKEFVYIMMNKPKGILSASNDKSRKTVVDLVKDEYKREGLFPVGRLDKDTTGLLIITDDGDFGHKVISPKSRIEKEYLVTLDKPLPETDAELLRQGVTLADGTVCRPAKVRYINDGKTLISMVITEGKYHEIKRMLGVVNVGVNELKRIRIGNLLLCDKLTEGDYREMSEEERYFVKND